MIRSIRRHLFVGAVAIVVGTAASAVSVRAARTASVSASAVVLGAAVQGDAPFDAVLFRQTLVFIKNNQNTTQFKAARAALVSASAIVLGAAVQDDVLLARWMIQLQEAPYSMMGLYNDGLKFSDAVTFLKKWQLQDASTSNIDRGLMIERTYAEVFGRAATAAEFAYWDAKVKTDKVWYAPIVLEHIGYLNSHKDARNAAIQRAYQAALGRAATPQEVAYWAPRNEHYRLIREASRSWLYSPQGSAELVATLTRALKATTGKTPADAELKAFLTAVSGMTPKPIFEEIVAKSIL